MQLSVNEMQVEQSTCIIQKTPPCFEVIVLLEHLSKSVCSIMVFKHMALYVYTLCFVLYICTHTI